MKSKALKLLVAMVVIPAAAWAADEVANRLEETRGPTSASKILHGASTFARRMRA